MVAIKNKCKAFAALLGRIATCRAAKAAFLFLILSSLLVFSVSADTYTFNINNFNYVDVSSISIETSPSQYNYKYLNGYLDTAYPLDVFNLDTHMFRFRFSAQDIGAAEFPSLIRFCPSATFNLPIPPGHYDETSVIFTLATGLYTNQDQSLLVDIIDDVAIIINGNTYTPISSSIKTNGTYWTFEVSISDLSDQTSLSIYPMFQDYPYPSSDPSYGNFPAEVWWMVQFSPMIFVGDRTASAQYAAAIEDLLENDIAPSLENIEGLMSTMNQQQAATNSQLAALPSNIGQEMSSALQSEADRELAYGKSEGDAQVQGAMGSFPTDSINQADSAIQAFANALGSDSRQCFFEMPSIEMPELRDTNGNIIMGKTKLTDPHLVDLGYYFDMLPSPIVIIIRAFVTLSLSMYVFKELFAFISMFKEG